LIPTISDGPLLYNGVQMPWLGLGVYQISNGQEVIQAVRTAVSAGYRSVDTASLYRNESGVGQAVRECGVPREELFITTKVWNSEQGFTSTLAAFESSRKKLGLDYIDLYMLHWPVKGKYQDSWRALEKLYLDGAVRAIGVCNFQQHHLETLMAAANVLPMVNQVEYHPLLAQKPLRDFCGKHRIQLEAWSPLMQGRLDLSLLYEIAASYGKSPAQVVLRWDVQNGVVTIPKSSNPDRIRENGQIFDFTLSEEDMERLGQLDRGQRFGPHPDHFHF
jgi:diketogulonate reductase-like aldo/keto reductase